MDDVLNLFRKRRSIRRYLDRDVPAGVVREILRESCLAPSAMNRQPWRFSVVANRPAIRRLSDESKKNLLAELVARAYFTDHPAKAAGDTGLTQENKNGKHTRIRQ